MSMAKKRAKKKVTKKPVKIENARSMKFAFIMIVIIGVIYLISPEKQKEEIKEVIPSVHETETITLTDDIKKEYEDWVKSIHDGLGAISTGTLREVTDENKLKFLIIHLNHTDSSQTYPLSEGSPITCIHKEQANTLLPTYFANAFSDVSILQYQEGESYQRPFKTDTGYCYQITEDDLKLVYTPGVAQACREIAKDKSNVYKYTISNAKSSFIQTILSASEFHRIMPCGSWALPPVGTCTLP